jgi:hypothetical protein
VFVASYILVPVTFVLTTVLVKTVVVMLMRRRHSYRG